MRAVLKGVVRTCLRPVLAPSVPLRWQRTWSGWILKSTPGPRGVRRQTVSMGGVPALELSGQRAGARALLYLHGGAYVLGDAASYAAFAARIGEAAGALTYVADYRLAPEYPYPAAVDDAVRAYRWLLETGYAAADIFLAGDSAGGGLSLATLLALREQGVALPGRVALISPWVDLTLSGESMRERATRDPMLRESWLAMGAAAYRGTEAAAQPGCSPLFGDLRGLPPMLIQVGSEEILFSDAERLAQRVRAAGGEATLQVFDGLWHDFQLHAGLLAQSDAAIASMGQFLRAG